MGCASLAQGALGARCGRERRRHTVLTQMKNSSSSTVASLTLLLRHTLSMRAVFVGPIWQFQQRQEQRWPFGQHCSGLGRVVYVTQAARATMELSHADTNWCGSQRRQGLDPAHNELSASTFYTCTSCCVACSCLVSKTLYLVNDAWNMCAGIFEHACAFLPWFRSPHCAGAYRVVSSHDPTPFPLGRLH